VRVNIQTQVVLLIIVVRLSQPVLSSAPATTGGGLKVLAKAEKGRIALAEVAFESPLIHGGFES